MTTTKEEIQLSINSRLKTNPTLTEGGTVQDIVGSVSFELANILDTKLLNILDNAFISTCNEEYLKIRGEELGIYKKAGSKTRVWAKITGASPNVQTADVIRAKTKDEIVFEAASFVTDDKGEALVLFECLEEGTIGNIKEGELSSFQEAYAGLETAKITNEKAGFDGFDPEETEDYRARILDYIRNNACNSNIADYIMWAKSVTGVKNVVVKDAFYAGAGHVDVYISAMNNMEVTEDLKNAVKSTIQKEQIINAIVNVFALSYLEINISATITIKEGYTKEEIESAFSKTFSDYLNTKPDIISYLYISNLFFEVKGIQDVTNYLLNGGQQSVQAGEFEIPVLGAVTFNVEEGE